MAMKKRGWRVVNFEDQGMGLDHADAVVNALYEMSHPSPHVYNGSQYYCLREEFYSATLRPVQDKVEQITICFGGTDPNRLTIKAIEAIAPLPADIRLSVILVLDFDRATRWTPGWRLCHRGRKSSLTGVISHYMEKSDIMITSGGRTVYEAAALGVEPSFCARMFVRSSICSLPRIMAL